jgi:hypothetical protein
MKSMQEQLAAVKPQVTSTPTHTGGPVSPLNPSRKATARVKNKLPIPKTCPNCSGPVSLMSHESVYGRAYGEWPWMYKCEDMTCNSSVGLHPYTSIPLGSLANAELRHMRMRAKAAFEPLWKNQIMSRTAAYVWLAGAMNLKTIEECHVGWFDKAQCEEAIVHCRAKLKESGVSA